MKLYITFFLLISTSSYAMTPAENEKILDEYQPIIIVKEDLRNIEMRIPQLYKPIFIGFLKQINQKIFFQFISSKIENKDSVSRIYERLTDKQALTDINEPSDVMPYNTLLHNASKSGNELLVNLLIHDKADITKTNMWGETPLHLATIYKENKIVELLIAQSALINTIDLYKRTPLHHAVRVENIKAIKVLLASGAATTIKDAYNRTAKEYAIKLGKPEVIALFDTENNTPRKRRKIE